MHRAIVTCCTLDVSVLHSLICHSGETLVTFRSQKRHSMKGTRNPKQEPACTVPCKTTKDSNQQWTKGSKKRHPSGKQEKQQQGKKGLARPPTETNNQQKSANRPPNCEQDKQPTMMASMAWGGKGLGGGGWGAIAG